MGFITDFEKLNPKEETKKEDSNDFSNVIETFTNIFKDMDEKYNKLLDKFEKLEKEGKEETEETEETEEKEEIEE